MLVPIGLAYFGVYYAAFRFCIQRFNLKTPGRDADEATAPAAVGSSGRGDDFIAALGGAANIQTVDACMTRLRLTLADPAVADDSVLKRLGARGVVRPGGSSLQVVLGPVADQVAGEIRTALSGQQNGEAERLVAALGGPANVRGLDVRANRLIVDLRDDAAADEAAIGRLGIRGFSRRNGGKLHLLLQPGTRWASDVPSLLRG